LNVLAIYPGMSERCDNANLLIRLAEMKVKLAVISSKTVNLKGEGSCPEYEVMAGVPIYRLFKNTLDMFVFPRGKLKACLKIASELKPDLIFCSQEQNLRLAKLLQKNINVPIVLLVEEASTLSTGERHPSFQFEFLMSLLGIPFGRRFWDWLCKNSSAIITCHPGDNRNLRSLSRFGKPVYYLPWPTHIPEPIMQETFPKQNRGIYIGSLYPFKNTQVFEELLPRILKETKTEEFLVIGPGPHAKMIQDLQKTSKNKVTYLVGVSRFDALKMIASSYYAFTPVKTGGWGFIGDCWSMKTPIVMCYNDHYVINGINALVAEKADALIANINRLYDDQNLFSTLQKNGYEESKKRHAGIVANGLYCIFVTTLGNSIKKAAKPQISQNTGKNQQI
jgi:glycosyltransferase involved in cell wall biosynthesis